MVRRRRVGCAAQEGVELPVFVEGPHTGAEGAEGAEWRGRGAARRAPGAHQWRVRAEKSVRKSEMDTLR